MKNYMKGLIKTGLIIVSSVFCVLTSNASEEALNDFFENTKSMQAAFMQRVFDESGVELERRSGQFSLLRPGRFRWDYDADIGDNSSDNERGQQIIADGKSIFIYDPDLLQVTQRSMENALSQVPSLILVQSGGDIKAHFKVDNIGMTDGLSWVSLSPKDPDAAYRKLMLGFDKKQLKSIFLFDGLGNETQLVLSDVRQNLSLENKLFDFKVPDGADLFTE